MQGMHKETPLHDAARNGHFQVWPKMLKMGTMGRVTITFMLTDDKGSHQLIFFTKLDDDVCVFL